MTKEFLIKKFEENIEKARHVYDRSEYMQLQMKDVIEMMEKQLKEFKSGK